MGGVTAGNGFQKSGNGRGYFPSANGVVNNAKNTGNNNNNNNVHQTTSKPQYAPSASAASNGPLKGLSLEGLKTRAQGGGGGGVSASGRSNASRYSRRSGAYSGMNLDSSHYVVNWID
jgi:hypothetical protein